MMGTGHLDHLHTMLNNKALVWIFTFLGVGFFYNVMIYRYSLIILAIVIILFTPYLLYVLYINYKWKWIYGFVIWMSIGSMPSLFLKGSDSVAGFIWTILPLVFFLLYCWFLNQYIRGWMISPHRVGEV